MREFEQELGGGIVEEMWSRWKEKEGLGCSGERNR